MEKKLLDKREHVRKKIIKEAAELFSKKGFHETRTKDIAERAGVSEPTLFRYFPTPVKNHILRAIFKECWGQFLQIAREVLSKTEKPFERFRMVLRGCVGYLLENPSILKVMLVEERQNNPELRALLITEEMLNFIELLSEVYRLEQIKGTFGKDYDPRSVIYTAIGIVETLLELHGTSGKYLRISCSPQDIEDICLMFASSFVLPKQVVEEVVFWDGKLFLSSPKQEVKRYVNEIRDSGLSIDVLTEIRQLPINYWRMVEEELLKIKLIDEFESKCIFAYDLDESTAKSFKALLVDYKEGKRSFASLVFEIINNESLAKIGFPNELIILLGRVFQDYFERGMLEAVMEREESEITLLGKEVARLFKITKPEEVFTNIPTLNCVEWKIARSDDNKFLVEAHECRFCNIVKKICSVSACEFFCLNPLKAVLQSVA
ncbi:MAG: TetR/AcrR family transcriptional regulator, partial [Candidatus Bathyarchaeia archaeon]